PLLRRQGPVMLEIVGAPPRTRVESADVVYHGRVPDVRPYYEAAHALVVPVFEGSGTRLKVIEAALLGRPVISTALGAEGLPIEPARDYLRAEDADGFARAAATLREEPATVEALADAARGRLAHLLWPRIAAELAELYTDALARAG